MKFGKRLEESTNSKYVHYYLSYSALKKAIKQYASRSGNIATLQDLTLESGAYDSIIDVESRFTEMLEKELTKVNLFSQSKMGDLRGSLFTLARRLESNPSDEELEDIQKIADAVAEDVIFLESFIDINLNGFRKIIKKHDKLIGMSVAPWFSARLCREPFCNMKFDEVLIALSSVYSAIRARKSPTSSSSSSSSSSRVLKFWVNLDNVMKCKVGVLKHIPIEVVSGSPSIGYKSLSSDSSSSSSSSASSSSSSADPASTSTKKKGKKAAATATTSSDSTSSSSSTLFVDETQLKGLRDSTLVTSVYFDNDAHEAYYQSVTRESGASVIRVQWYEENSGALDKELFVERRTYAAAGAEPKKEGLPVKQKKLKEFLAGKFSLDKKIEKAKEGRDLKLGQDSIPVEVLLRAGQISKEIQAQMLASNLVPCMRTTYLKTGFKLAEGAVSVAVHSRISMVLEKVKKPEDKEWCRSLTDPIGLNEVVRFPYSVMEVKISSQQFPPWLQEMVQSLNLTEVSKFSKFQHGIAYLYKPVLRQLPHWFDSFAKAYEEEQAKVLKDMEDAFAAYKKHKHSNESPEELEEKQRRKELKAKAKEEKKRKELEEQQKEAKRQAAAAAKSSKSKSSSSSSSSAAPAPPKAVDIVSSRGLPDPAHVGFHPGSPAFRARKGSAAAASGETRVNVEGSSSSSPRRGFAVKLKSCLGFAFKKKNPEGYSSLSSGPSSLPTTTSSAAAADNKGANIKIEPKTFFANERTLLSWLHSAVMLCTVSMSLLNLGDDNARICGLLMAPIALFFILYAFKTYYSRLTAILRRDPVQYDDHFGPTVLVFFLLISMCSVITFNLATVSFEDE